MKESEGDQAGEQRGQLSREFRSKGVQSILQWTTWEQKACFGGNKVTGIYNYLEDNTELVNTCLKQFEQNSASGKIILMSHWIGRGRKSSYRLL